jgi:calcineurin-like phosphoesterase family protein
MSKVKITQQYLTDIADAIRSKLNTSDTYLPSEMADAIESISGGSVSELVENPDYFIAECIDTAQKINALRNDHTLLMFFITDSHVYTSNNNLQYLDVQLASMNALAKMLKPDLVVHGGDMTNGSEAKATTIAFTDHIVACMREIGGDDTHILIGNHDGNTVQSGGRDNETERITEAEMLTMYRSWDDGFTYAGSNYQGGNFYGYRDYNSIGLRVIRLHSYIEDIGNPSATGGMGGNWGYYADELTWFQNVALNTDNDILIICHQTLSPVLQGYPESQDIPHRGTSFQQAIDSWLNANSSHRCVGVVHGHIHWDYASKGKGTFNVIDHSTKQTISRTGSYGNFYEHAQCFCNYMPSFGTADSAPTSSYRDVPVDAIFRGRTAGTASQGLWTAVVVDTDAEKISFIRFGAGPDRVFGYGSTVYHTIANSLTGVTTSNPATSVEDGTAYTATITADSGYTIDSVSVMMGGTDITSTAYSNGVITIASVTGNVSITVTASKPKVNLLPTALDTDGASIYPAVSHSAQTSVGYASGYRLGSGGTESSASGKYVTGFIPCKQGDKITLENISVNAVSQDNDYIALYDSSFNKLYSRYGYAWIAQTGAIFSPHTESGGVITSFTLTGGTHSGTNYDFSNVAYMRLSAGSITDASAIYVE